MLARRPFSPFVSSSSQLRRQLRERFLRCRLGRFLCLRKRENGQKSIGGAGKIAPVVQRPSATIERRFATPRRRRYRRLSSDGIERTPSSRSRGKTPRGEEKSLNQQGTVTYSQHLRYQDVCNQPLAHLLARSLALRCSVRSRALLRSRTHLTVERFHLISMLILTPVLNHCARASTNEAGNSAKAGTPESTREMPE